MTAIASKDYAWLLRAYCAAKFAAASTRNLEGFSVPDYKIFLRSSSFVIVTISVSTDHAFKCHWSLNFDSSIADRDIENMTTSLAYYEPNANVHVSDSLVGFQSDKFSDNQFDAETIFGMKSGLPSCVAMRLPVHTILSFIKFLLCLLCSFYCLN